MAKITLLKREQINLNAWDDCIHNAPKPLVYANSWYLDAICDNQWSALVYGNYQAVMPLPTKTRWAIPMVYQPFFCQQLGVFSQTPNPPDYSAFLQKIPFTFLKVGLHMNNSQAFPPGIKTKTNFLLNLHDDYDVLFSRFTSDARKNIRQATNAGVIVSESEDFGSAIELYKNIWGPANPLILDTHYKRFEKACSTAFEQQNIFCVEARLNENLLGKAIFLKNHRYLHYVCAAPTPEGKKWGIMHSIINFAIQQHADSPMILDFEGSEIPGVADFYKKFNPVEERYAVYSRMLF
jgi:hypothetical protein